MLRVSKFDEVKTRAGKKKKRRGAQQPKLSVFAYPDVKLGLVTPAQPPLGQERTHLRQGTFVVQGIHACFVVVVVVTAPRVERVNIHMDT